MQQNSGGDHLCKIKMGLPLKNFLSSSLKFDIRPKILRLKLSLYFFSKIGVKLEFT